MTKDLRTISSEDIKALRIRAVEEVGKSHNISKVSRELGINRQVLYSWLNKCKSVNRFDKDNRGRPNRKIYKAQIYKIVEILAKNSPTDLGIDSIFWSVSSVRKLIDKSLDINASAYLIRNWLLKWGFFKGRTAEILKKSSVASKGLSV
jgi:transposase